MTEETSKYIHSDYVSILEGVNTFTKGQLNSLSNLWDVQSRRTSSEVVLQDSAKDTSFLENCGMSTTEP